jgi:hypothetical protein
VITLLTAAAVSERASAFLAAVSVAPGVLELRPDYRALVMVAEGLHQYQGPARLVRATIDEDSAFPGARSSRTG